MAKKAKRAFNKPITRAVDSATTAEKLVAEVPQMVSSRQVSSADFSPDYSYVRKDLRRIGTLALAFFAILILLSFIL